MIMNGESSAMPGPFEPPAQPECCPTPFVTPFDSSDGMLKLKLLAVVAENKALNEERENLLQKYSDTQQQFLQLQKLQEGCFGCHKLKEKDYKYYTGFTKEQFDAVYISLVPTDEDPIKWSKTVKGSKSLSTTYQLLLVLIKLRQNFDFQHISHLFNISSQDSSAIFTQWINYMFFRLGSF